MNRETKLRIAGIVNDSVVDGLGIRMTLFTQGCPHRCEGCHNPHTHDYSGGYEITLGEIADKVKGNPLLDGMTFSGGEPFEQAEALSELAVWLHENGLDLWCYSGYTYEQLMAKAEQNSAVDTLLEYTDVLVDGRFEQDKKNLLLNFRGSENQRVIDMNKTREQGEIVLLDV